MHFTFTTLENCSIFCDWRLESELSPPSYYVTMKISIAICTWNRSRLLRKTLEQFRRIKTDDRFTWELIIVNNCSTDDTVEVINEFTAELPIKSVYEPILGHARSRNHAINAADGDYLIWTDNDVLVSRDWLVAYFLAFIKEPEIVFFGGPILPEFESPCPAWIEATWEKCKGVYATRMLGDEPIDLTSQRLPYGANFAIRMDAQRNCLFDTALGRQGNDLLGGEEIQMLRKISTQGGRGRWVPDAKLKHVIPEERTTIEYVKRYFVGQGKINVVQKRQRKGKIGSLMSSCFHSMCYRLKQKKCEPKVWVSHMINSSIYWGEFSMPRMKRGEELRT